MNNLLQVQIFEKLNEQDSRHVVHQGVRRFSQGLPGKKIIFFNSNKNMGLMPCESTLEADHCLTMEFESEVQKYWVQPFKLRINNRLYTPDILLITDSGRAELREVKFSGKLECPKLAQRLDDIEEYCLAEGVPFSVKTDQEIHIKPHLKNYKYIYSRALRLPMNKVLLIQALDLLSLKSKLTLEICHSALINISINPQVAEYLIFNNYLSFDTDSLLHKTTPLWLTVKGKQL